MPTKQNVPKVTSVKNKKQVRRRRGTLDEHLCKSIEEKIKQMSTYNPECTEDDSQTEGYARQHFHMDFGFVRGSGCIIKQEDKSIITIINGLNSYLIIVDRVTRFPVKCGVK